MKQQKIKLRSYIFVSIQFLSMGLIIITGSVKPSGIYFSLVLAGIILVAWAIKTMEPGNFNVVPDLKENSKLVTSGPYNFIRHPMYSAILLIFLGFTLNDFNVYRLIIWIILLINLVLKLTYEEEILTESFFEYPQYKKQTKKLIPFIF